MSLVFLSSLRLSGWLLSTTIVVLLVSPIYPRTRRPRAYAGMSARGGSAFGGNGKICRIAFGARLHAETGPVGGGDFPDQPTAPLAEIRLRNILNCMTLGRKLFREGDYRRSAMEFEKVLQLDPTNSSAADYLGECKRRLKK